MDTLAVYTLQEVKKHASPTDAWIIIHGNVYDVTKYLNTHPGGLYILYNKCGGDGTDSFENMFHSSVARSLLDKMKIGTLDSTQQGAYAIRIRIFCVSSHCKY
jgi:cytochrome-b5 reductase